MALLDLCYLIIYFRREHVIVGEERIKEWAYTSASASAWLFRVPRDYIQRLTANSYIP